MEYPSVLSAQDVADMMSFGRPAASAPAQSVAEAPPEAYLLYAVLVHVGGTQGGHYFAYVRPGPGVEGAACAGDAWVEFNDGEVREVSEGVVLSCCGCEEGAGMVKRSKAPTAYMLMYRARGVTARTSGVAVPAAARQIVEALNASVRERREADAARLNRLECLVRWDPRVLGGKGGGSEASSHELTLTRTCAADEAAASVVAQTSELLPPAGARKRHVRVRVWDEAASVPGQILAGGTLNELVGSGTKLALYLEILPAGAKEFAPVFAGGITLRVMRFVGGEGGETFVGPTFVSVEGGGKGTCMELAARLEDCMGVKAEAQRWVVVLEDTKRGGGGGQPVCFSPADVPGDLLSLWGLASNGASLYLDGERVRGGAGALEALEALWYSTTLTFAPREQGREGGMGGKTKESKRVTVAVDTRVSVAAMRQLVSSALNDKLDESFQPQQLRLFLAGKGELKDSSLCVAQVGVCSGDTVLYARGTPLQPHEFVLGLVSVRLSDLALEQTGGDCGVKQEVVASEQNDVADLYQTVARATQMPHDSFRLRKVVGGGGGVGTVLRQGETLSEALVGICDGLNLAVQRLTPGSKAGGCLSRTQVSLFVRRLVVEPGAAEGGAGRCLLEDAVEVVLARDVTAVDATEKVATAVGLQGGDSGESLHATAPTCAGIISGDADLAATVDWLPVAAVLLGAADTAASEGGLAVKEGALIYVRDVRQKLPPPKRSTAPERGVSIRREGTARDGQASAVTGGPGAPPLPPPLPGGGAPRAPPPPPPLPP